MSVWLKDRETELQLPSRRRRSRRPRCVLTNHRPHWAQATGLSSRTKPEPVVRWMSRTIYQNLQQQRVGHTQPHMNTVTQVETSQTSLVLCGGGREGRRATPFRRKTEQRGEEGDHYRHTQTRTQTHTQVHIPYWLKPSCAEVYPVAVVMDGEVTLLLGALFSPSASTDCESLLV